MSANDKEPEARKERYRRAVAFLEGARHLPELSPWQIERIERHLNRPRPRRGARPLWMPALAALALVLLAGAALAVTGTGLGRVPILGPLIAAIWRPEPARAPRPRLERRPDPAPGVTPPAAASVIPAPAPPALAAGRGGPQTREPLAAVPPAPPPAVPAPPLEFAEALAPAAGPARATARRRRSDTTRAPEEEPRAQPETSTATTGPAALAVPLSAAPAAAPTEHAVPAAPLPATTPDPVAAPAATAETPIVAESRSFAAALARWQRDHDASAALAALDAHEQRFPAGEIRLEAQLLRAEILLAGGRERDSLALLDPLALSGLPRARELRTVRGELRIKLGRCSDGKSDLGAVLADGDSDALAQRARLALASCR